MEFIFLVFTAIAAIAAGSALYFSWRYCEGKLVSKRTLPFALISGFIFTFLLAILLALLVPSWTNFAIRWFGGNGFAFASILAMAGVLIQHQIMTYFTKRY